MSETEEIRPHPGPQWSFLETKADICLYGGGAGGGKSWALLLEGLRHIGNPGFTAVIFRRIRDSIKKPGSLWDQSMRLYSSIVKQPPNLSELSWQFPSGAGLSFGSLQYETDLMKWHSSEICYIGFDEVTEMSERSFFYLLSRNRSTCGVRPYVRASCNPDSESWIAKFVEWWIDQETGLPISEPWWPLIAEQWRGVERSGVIRWFVRDGDEIIWGTKEELVKRYGPLRAKSFTFIPARLEDNPTLETINPEYRANLESLPTTDRERLLGNNWKIRPSAGKLFPRTKWQFCQEAPAEARLCRYVDKAAHEGTAGARTAMVLVGESKGRWYIVHARAGRWSEFEVEDQIKTIAYEDRARYGWRVRTCVEREPGSGGKFSARSTIKNLAGFDVGEKPARTAKHIAWKPLASQVQAENVWIVTGDPNAPAAWDWGEFINELDVLAGDPKQDAKRLRDLCCAEGTMIYTESGERPIETVLAGERVWTRNGLRSVLWSGATGMAATLYRLKTDDTHVDLTAGHRVWNEDKKQFTAIDAAAGAFKILTCKHNQLHRQKSCSTAIRTNGGQSLQDAITGSITFGGIANRKLTLRCTLQCGLRRMDLFRKEWLSTTPILIRSITRSPIYSALQGPSTDEFTTRLGHTRPMLAVDRQRLLGSSQRRGTRLKRDWNGIANTASGLCERDASSSGYVANAEMSLAPNNQPPCAVQSFAAGDGSIGYRTGRFLQCALTAVANTCLPKNAEPDVAAAHVQSVIAINRKMPIRVFNLQVDQDPEYFANGVLVHNCDAASGAANELMGAGDVYLNRPLLCSGGDYEGSGDVNQPLTEDELTGLPDILADIMRGARRDSGGGYGRD